MKSTSINIDISVRGEDNPRKAYQQLFEFMKTMSEQMTWETLSAASYDEEGNELELLDGESLVKETLALTRPLNPSLVDSAKWISKEDKYPPENTVVWIKTYDGIYRATFQDSWQFTGWRIQLKDNEAFIKNNFKTVLFWQPVEDVNAR